VHNIRKQNSTIKNPENYVFLALNKRRVGKLDAFLAIKEGRRNWARLKPF